MQAMPQAQASLSSPACSTFSSLLLVLTHKTKKWLHYTLNTLHQTLHNTLIILPKHAKYHKSLKSQNSLSLLLLLLIGFRQCRRCWAYYCPPQVRTRCLCHCHCCCQSSAVAPSTTSPVPQQPNHMIVHIILWLVGVVPFSTNRNMFSCLQTLPACGQFCDKSPFLPFLPAPDTQQTWQ